ncbi:DUF6226 family protein [Rhodococcus opacus]|uniref:DUF6226 family protein n=2 Tax=Rhodococcus opacus TaxID=37919 RepID=A0AAX3YQB7_RHOOP|nr:DUF6226 family protein [Rhodococcus opacus]MCZ4590043.1 DUF6226 family protein [Rhodococcus opacus]WLF51040.1 DUF6226 family protein [Rhodococcus opacus]
MCELLDDVDAAFAVTGAHTPGWPNPYQDGPEPDEEAYERSTNPEKFLIVVARVRAWTKVLRWIATIPSTSRLPPATRQ